MGSALAGCAAPPAQCSAPHTAHKGSPRDAEWSLPAIDAPGGGGDKAAMMAKKQAMADKQAMMAKKQAMADKQAMMAKKQAMADKAAMMAKKQAMADKQAMMAKKRAMAEKAGMVKKHAMAEKAGMAKTPMTLQEKLLSPEWARMGSLTFHRFTGGDSTHPVGGRVRGDRVSVYDSGGRKLTLASLLTRPTVLVMMRGFYGNVCPYCTTYTAQLAARYEEFRRAGVNVLLVYPTKAEHAAEVKTFTTIVREIIADEGQDAIPFPVYLDRGLELVKRYNLNGDVSKPSTLVLDRTGRIRYLYVGRNTTDRPSVDRVLAEAVKVTKTP